MILNIIRKAVNPQILCRSDRSRQNPPKTLFTLHWSRGCTHCGLKIAVRQRSPKSATGPGHDFCPACRKLSVAAKRAFSEDAISNVTGASNTLPRFLDGIFFMPRILDIFWRATGQLWPAFAIDWPKKQAVFDLRD